MFQYGIECLRGLASFERTEVIPVAVFGSDTIEEFVENERVEAHRTNYDARLANYSGLFVSTVAAAGVPLPLIQACGRRVDRLARFLSDLSCDLWLFPAGDPVVYHSALPSVVSVHDLMHRYEPRFPEVGNWWMRLRRELHYRALCKTAQMILVDSRLGAEHVQHSYGVSPSRVSILPYCAPSYLNAPQITPSVPTLPEKYFYYPAQFWPHKNHLNLARAVRRCLDLGHPIHIVLAGGQKGSHKEFIRLTKQLRIDHLFTELGFVSPTLVRHLYSRSAGLIYPSYFGPTNIPPLEALVCGVPMGLSNNYAMEEQIGDAAIYFSPDDVEAMAQTLIALESDSRLTAHLIEVGRLRSAYAMADRFHADLRSIVRKQLQFQAGPTVDRAGLQRQPKQTDNPKCPQ